MKRHKQELQSAYGYILSKGLEEEKMKKLTNFVFLFALVCFLSSTLWADEVAAKSRISSVTVYPDRAAVIREAHLDLGHGKHSVVFDCLPSTLIASSIRVSGSGTAEVRILGMDISRQFLESAFLPEIQKLKASVEAVKIEITKVKDRMDVLDSQEKFLKSIEYSSLDRASLEVALGKPDVQSWEKTRKPCWFTESASRISGRILLR